MEKKMETEKIVWREERSDCLYGYIKDYMYFKVYRWPLKKIWMLSDNLYMIREKIGNDTPCVSKESAQREAQNRVDKLFEILSYEKKKA
jgi:hypothetical protein